MTTIKISFLSKGVLNYSEQQKGVRMVTDQQVRRLLKMLKKERSLDVAALKSSMDIKTARKYRDIGKLPSEIKVDHNWRTRKDPFSDIWDETKSMLRNNPGLEAKTIFEYFQRQLPDIYQDGQLRTLQRHIKQWRALEGPSKEIFFPQIHHPGELSQSDFTRMSSLNITINKYPFEHMIYHFVLTYSNWETGTICFSESFEAVSEGMQNAFWELGGVSKSHRTDQLTAAVQKASNPDEFTKRYQALLNHYRIKGEKIQVNRPNENGDVEQSHNRFKKAVNQSLLLRGSRDFVNVKEYELFLKTVFKQLNSGRRVRFKEEIDVLHELPQNRIESCKRLRMKVGPSSTIRVNHNVYSVHSRLIGEYIDVKLYADKLEIWYAQRCVEKIPRLRGEEKYYIQYRHIIDSLIRKPGAFENYRYKSDLFPTTHFRLVFDKLHETQPTGYNKEYLKILNLAAKENEGLVDNAIKYLIETSTPIKYENIEKLVKNSQAIIPINDVDIQDVNINIYDTLLQHAGVIL